MKKSMIFAAIFLLCSCVKEYYIPLSDQCMIDKIAEIKAHELKDEAIKGRAFKLGYEERKENELLGSYDLGTLKFDERLKASFLPSRAAQDPQSFDYQMRINTHIAEIIQKINTDGYIEAVYMRPFDMDCYSGGGSVKIPYWLIEQEVRFRVKVSDKKFLSALRDYFLSEKLSIGTVP